MWSSIENFKENLHKIALDVHEDDDEEDDLQSYGSANGVSGSDRRNSSGFRSSRSAISNGIGSPAHHEVFAQNRRNFLLKICDKEEYMRNVVGVEISFDCCMIQFLYKF